MAKITEQVAIAVGVQAAEGTAHPATATATELDIAEAGSAAIGLYIQDDSLSLDFDRVESENADVSGTFSKTAGGFERIDVPLAFDTNMQGGGDPTPESSGEWNVHAAIDVLLQGLGIYNPTESVGNTAYIPENDLEFLTIKIWRGTVAWVFKDCKVESLAVPLTPGSAAQGTWTVLVGSIDSKAVTTFPALTGSGYGTQASMAAPVLRSAACAIGGVTRGFLDGTVTITNDFAEYGDCNAATGIVNERDGRTIGFAGSVYVDSTDVDQDYEALIAEVAPTGDMLFTLGDTLGDASNPAQALKFDLKNVQWTQNSYVREAGRIVWALDGYATNDGAGDDEFILSGV